MPELPEVETMRRGILASIGSTIVGCGRIRCTRRSIAITPETPAFRRKVLGARIERLARVGKRVVIWLENHNAIVIEPRMTGLLLIDESPSAEHLRWRLQLEGGPIPHIQYWDRRGLGSIKLISELEFQAIYAPEKIGPDALEIDADDLHKRLGASQREIKVALMDQRVVAGIGNIYASEILHVAGIHPQHRCHSITARQWQKVCNATHEVLLQAIKYEGSSLNNGTYRNVLNKRGRYQYSHLVYNRHGERCTQCQRGLIQRILQCQRSSFFCGRCQRLETGEPRGPASGSETQTSGR